MDLTRAHWRRSSLSGNNGGNCIEVTVLENVTDGPEHKSEHPKLIAVRDSKDPNGPALFFTPAEWDAFIGGVKNNEFDLS